MSLHHETLLISEKEEIYLDFARFVRTYTEAKDFLRNGHLLDSFNNILHSLEYWARLAVLENGEQPAASVWEQMKNIDSTVYKLYEELVTSQEPLEKRIELLLLALDFTVLSKMENCVQFLLDILKSRTTPWSVTDIAEHPVLANPQYDVLAILDKMAKRSLIKEQVVIREGVHEKCYSVV